MLKSILLLHLTLSYVVSGPNGTSCLQPADKLVWERRFDIKNKDLPIIIETTDRPSHQISSRILKILLKERLGYKKVELNRQDWDETKKNMERLSCDTNSTNSQPCNSKSSINLEVWMGPGFDVENWVNDKKVIDSGPLGPIARRGIFVERRLADYYSNTWSLDHWRILTNLSVATHLSPPSWFSSMAKNWEKTISCSYEEPNCIRILYNQPDMKFSLLKLKNILKTPNFAAYQVSSSQLLDVVDRLNKSSTSDGFLYIADWYPSTVTVRSDFVRVSFPDCYDTSESPVKINQFCDFEVNQLTKVVWHQLQDHAPMAYELVDQMDFSQSQYASLLSEVQMHTTDEYEKIACSWIRNNSATWREWTINWRSQYSLVIGGMFATAGKWKLSPNIKNIAEDATTELNKQLFNNSEYKLQLDVRDLSCEQPKVLHDYIQQSNNNTKNSQLIGIIAALCSDAIEPMVMLTTLERRIVVSPTVESAKYFDIKTFPYFFRTVPTMEVYNDLIETAFGHWKWKRFVFMRKDDHFLNKNSIPKSTISDFHYDEKKVTVLSIRKFLQQCKDKYLRIFVVEYFAEVTAMILCEAFKLNMMFSEGYVWFLNPWLSPEWYANSWSSVNCTKDQLEQIIDRHLRFNYGENAISNEKNNPVEQYGTYTRYAVRVLGLAIHKVLQEEKSALSDLLSLKVANKYRTFMENLSGSEVRDASNSGFFTNKNGRNADFWVVQQFQKGKQPPVVVLKLTKNSKKSGYTVFAVAKLMDVWLSNNPPSDGSRELNSCYDPFNIGCDSIIGIVNVVAFFVIIIFVILGCCLWRRYNKNKEDFTKKPYEELCNELQDLDMPSTSIVLNRRVGQGAFGLVYGGEAKKRNKWEAVAVKVINNNTSYQGKVDFLSEAKLMRDLKHPNVVRLIGICLSPPEDVIYLVMEFMLLGDLKTYLLSRRVVATQDPNHDDIRPEVLTKFAIDIASGLDYMHKTGLIHRDIACRNCLVGIDGVIKTVKIGDFGLTRRMTVNKAEGYYRFTKNCELPIRWMSPEAVQFGIFSVQSDLWSFGIVLYEIITFGIFPYDGLGDVEVVERVKRHEFSIQEFLPQAAYDTPVWSLIMQCCQYRPDNRPKSMSEIIDDLRKSPECIRPYLSDEPPKPANVTLSTFPFQPGGGAAMMTEPGPRSMGLSKPGKGSSRHRICNPPDYLPTDNKHSGPASFHQASSTEYLPLQDMKDEPSVSSAPDYMMADHQRVCGYSSVPLQLDIHTIPIRTDTPRSTRGEVPLPVTDQANGRLLDEHETLLQPAHSWSYIAKT